jgi:hypothetical protein
VFFYVLIFENQNTLSQFPNAGRRGRNAERREKIRGIGRKEGRD